MQVSVISNSRDIIWRTIRVEENSDFRFSNIPLVNVMFQFTAKQFNGQPNFVIANTKKSQRKSSFSRCVQ